MWAWPRGSGGSHSFSLNRILSFPVPREPQEFQLEADEEGRCGCEAVRVMEAVWAREAQVRPRKEGGERDEACAESQILRKSLAYTVYPVLAVCMLLFFF